jgi:hypothetical protein
VKKSNNRPTLDADVLRVDGVPAEDLNGAKSGRPAESRFALDVAGARSEAPASCKMLARTTVAGTLSKGAAGAGGLRLITGGERLV